MPEQARIDLQPQVAYALKLIETDYGDRVSVDGKAKQLLKFGESEQVGTSLTEVSTLPAGTLTETLSTSSNNITTVVSDSGSDTGTVYFEGHYFNSGRLNFTSGTVTLTGLTPVTLPVACSRLTRARSTSQSSMVGNVYFYEGGGDTDGVPDDDDQVHLILQAGQTQTQKCATSISASDYWIISRMTASVLEKTTASAQIRIEVKSATSSIWYPLTQYVAVSNASGTFDLVFFQLKIVPSNSDVRLVAIASGPGIHIAGGISGWLAN